MNNSQLYSKWRWWLMQLQPDKCETQLTNLILLIMRLYLSKSVHLNLVGVKVPIRAKKLSLVKRLSRFLENEVVDIEAWYAEGAEWLIRSASSGVKFHLIVDKTKVKTSCSLLCVALAYQGRALLIIWDWVGHRKGHCTVNTQLKV